MRCECGQEIRSPGNPLQRAYDAICTGAVAGGCPREALGDFHDMRVCRDYWRVRAEALAAEAGNIIPIARQVVKQLAGRGWYCAQEPRKALAQYDRTEAGKCVI